MADFNKKKRPPGDYLKDYLHDSDIFAYDINKINCNNEGCIENYIIYPISGNNSENPFYAGSMDTSKYNNVSFNEKYISEYEAGEGNIFDKKWLDLNRHVKKYKMKKPLYTKMDNVTCKIGLISPEKITLLGSLDIDTYQHVLLYGVMSDDMEKLLKDYREYRNKKEEQKGPPSKKTKKKKNDNDDILEKGKLYKDKTLPNWDRRVIYCYRESIAIISMDKETLLSVLKSNVKFKNQDPNYINKKTMVRHVVKSIMDCEEIHKKYLRLRHIKNSDFKINIPKWKDTLKNIFRTDTKDERFILGKSFMFDWNFLEYNFRNYQTIENWLTDNGLRRSPCRTERQWNLMGRNIKAKTDRASKNPLIINILDKNLERKDILYYKYSDIVNYTGYDEVRIPTNALKGSKIKVELFPFEDTYNSTYEYKKDQYSLEGVNVHEETKLIFERVKPIINFDKILEVYKILPENTEMRIQDKKRYSSKLRRKEIKNVNILNNYSIQVKLESDQQEIITKRLYVHSMSGARNYFENNLDIFLIKDQKMDIITDYPTFKKKYKNNDIYKKIKSKFSKVYLYIYGSSLLNDYIERLYSQIDFASELKEIFKNLEGYANFNYDEANPHYNVNILGDGGLLVLTTIFHEIGHIMLGHLNFNLKRFKNIDIDPIIGDRSDILLREIETESFTLLCMQTLGIKDNLFTSYYTLNGYCKEDALKHIHGALNEKKKKKNNLIEKLIMLEAQINNGTFTLPDLSINYIIKKVKELFTLCFNLEKIDIKYPKGEDQEKYNTFITDEKERDGILHKLGLSEIDKKNSIFLSPNKIIPSGKYRDENGELQDIIMDSNGDDDMVIDFMSVEDDSSEDHTYNKDNNENTSNNRSNITNL